MTDDDHIRFMLDGGTRGEIGRVFEAKDSLGVADMGKDDPIDMRSSAKKPGSKS